MGFQVRGEANDGLFSNICLKTVRYGESEAESNEQDNQDDGKDQNSDANETGTNESDDANENGNDLDEGNSDMNSGDDSGENNDEGLAMVISDDEIGEMYYKPARKEDLVTDKETGIRYVGNQILVSAIQNASKESVTNLFEKYGAMVVGFIELTNDFQIEFTEDKTCSELKTFIERLEESDLIASASLNVSNETEGDGSWTEYECNDELYNDGVIALNVGGDTTEYTKKDPDELTDVRFHGDNWALKELNVPGAWKLVGESAEQVRVGILDVGFVEGGHEDLSMLHVYNNSDDKRNHGTHVAGIIGADHNDIGIAGVATNVQMYGWASDRVDSVMGDKVALATLVGKHVRVINYSVGYLDEIAYSIQIGTLSGRYLLDERRKAYTEFLNKLYELDYDFIVIAAAGNGNNKKYSLANNPVGLTYIVDDHGKRIKEIETDNNSEFNSITDPYLMNRIVVVASTRPEKPGMPKDDLVSGFNCVGERVDVYAPGEDILSTVPVETEGTDIPGYKMDQGTSFAAPHISGIAALMYQANPDLRADQVKQIICADENSIGSYTDSMGVTRNMPDAEKCVRAALEMKDGEQPKNPKENGIVIGKILLSNGSESGIVKVVLTENNLSTPRENDTYEFSSTTDGTIACSVPEGNYKMVIQKEGYASLTIWDVEVKSEETNDLGEMELTRIPQLMQLKGWISHLRQGIPGTTIRIRQGLRNKTGEYLKDGNGVVMEACSDENGYYDIEILEGDYTFEFSKDGYAPEYYSVRMEPDKTGKQTIERDIDVMYKYDEVYKIVLDWRYSSVDLDIAASVISYGRNVARVQPKKNDNWLIYPDIRVLKDVKDGSESEIILIANADEILNGDKIYLAISVADEGCRAGTFCGLHYSTQAKISLYKGEKLLQVFEVPRDIDRRVWYAFNIKEGDRIEVVNRNTDAIP
ncbi:MAG: S8 family serine peptidase [Lachnospiraceae bacterium]|nr:S8 family serine peptidase [Lachnospiraceae bacterium]